MKKMTRIDSSKPRAVPGDLRRHNRGLVLERMFRSGAISRTALAESTGLTAAAISRITRELVEAGLVRELSHDGGPMARGRPQVELELAAEGAYVVGVGIGAFEQWIRIADLRGECVSRRAIQLLDQPSARAAVKLLVREIRALLAVAKIPRRRILGVGIASAGVVDREGGRIIESPNMGWRDLAIGELVSVELGLPTSVESMHHALNLAEEAFGSGQARGDSVLVNASMGIGASVMEQGRIVRGRHSAAGQIGHMSVPGAKELCTCGRRGCLDTVASGYAVLRKLGQIPERRVAREHDAAAARKLLAAIERERQGEPRVRQAFQASGEHLGDALNAVRALLDPQRIVLAGPLGHTASYLKGVRLRLAERDGGGGTAGAPLLVEAAHTSDSAGACLALGQFAFGSGLELADLAK
jgi:predicted NBD/HSP70 family sugar kinase